MVATRMEMLRSFEPIATPGSRLLILGSMPSSTSLEKYEYYGHASNAFWPILAHIFNFPIDSYAAKRQLLELHDIALWDVLAECTRLGSADASIRDVKINDIKNFLFLHPHLRMIICNGAVAMRLFKRYGPPFSPVARCPSTSAANTMQFARKAELWSAMIKKGLEKY